MVSHLINVADIQDYGFPNVFVHVPFDILQTPLPAPLVNP